MATLCVMYIMMRMWVSQGKSETTIDTLPPSMTLPYCENKIIINTKKTLYYKKLVIFGAGEGDIHSRSILSQL